MLQIIFIILKTIGIILASILGLILILILIVLFTPIRYRIMAQKYEEILVNVKIGWILRIFYFTLCYEKEKLIYQFRIFGFLVKDSETPPKEKKQKVKDKKEKSRKVKSKKVKSKDGKSEKINNERNVFKSTHRNKRNKTIYDKKEQGNKDDEKEDESISTTDKEINEVNQDSTSFKSHGENTREVHSKVPLLDDKKQSFWERLSHKIKLIILRIKNIFRKIIEFFKKIKHKIKEIIVNIKTFVHKIYLIKDFFSDDINKEGIKKIWRSIKKLVKHIYPTKIKANIRFGTGDPCTTGQALGIISLTYHRYKNNVKIIPDFNEATIEGDLFAKGRIQLFAVLLISIRLILDKNFKHLLNQFQKLKEEL